MWQWNRLSCTAASCRILRTTVVARGSGRHSSWVELTETAECSHTVLETGLVQSGVERGRIDWAARAGLVTVTNVVG